ncbi:PIN domain-containing protein [Massilia sp. R2A-15]|uniref:PIN domain-containing protein n=1 Tax=Massilia sp. R2A-15 TaxID=3064278 RepID=UPI002736A21F|nr:PIN domain-containing protein [Massilia sp. R2A-15]WLI89238.1 PIN domain-containing protein [Massilia sp. R2A-15]
MTKKLLLVDYENIQKIDLSLLDESYSAIIFVGARQNPPKAASKAATAHRFQRVDFQKIEGTGKNALDFQIAFHLGRTVEKSPATEFIVLSADKGFDPLLTYINKAGFTCRRIERIEDLRTAAFSLSTNDVVCERCHRSSTIPHHGGQWCTNCGRFASPPDPLKLPSNTETPDLFPRQRRFGPLTIQPSSSQTKNLSLGRQRNHDAPPIRKGMACGWCSYFGDMSGGIYDDGEWMCSDCTAKYSK